MNIFVGLINTFQNLTDENYDREDKLLLIFFLKWKEYLCFSFKNRTKTKA